MTLDIERLRAETPGVAARVHLNNAGAGLMPPPVLDAMIGHLRREARSVATRLRRRARVDWMVSMTASLA